MKKLICFTLVLLLMITGCSNKDKEEQEAQEQEPKQILESEIVTNLEISTIAEDSTSDIEDGFFQPAGVTQDAEGNLYISDYQNHVIRYISTDGELETLAGYSNEIDEFNHPVGELQDGSASEAQFNLPIGLAIDSENNIYIADSGNGAIRKLSKDGEVETTVEGLLHPFDIVINEEDEIFFSDALSHEIYQLRKDGTLEVFAGGGYEEEDGYPVGAYQEGQGESAQFNEPSGLAFTPSGDLLVADTGNQRIRLISTNGEVSTVAGSGDTFIPGTMYINGGYEDGAVDEAQFNFPKGVIALNDNQFIIADTYNHVLRLIDNGEVSTFAGTTYAGFVDGNQSTAQFYNPYAISFVDNRLVVVDQYNHAIREVQFNIEE